MKLNSMGIISERAVLALHDNVIDFDTFKYTNKASSAVVPLLWGKPSTKFV